MSWRVDVDPQPDGTLHVWPDEDTTDHELRGAGCVQGVPRRTRQPRRPRTQPRHAVVFGQRAATFRSSAVFSELCTLGGTEHDYRPKTYEVYPGCRRTSLVCVWCTGVACGYPSEADPCIEPYHHARDHRTAAGTVWPKGGNRPDPAYY